MINCEQNCVGVFGFIGKFKAVRNHLGPLGVDGPFGLLIYVWDTLVGESECVYKQLCVVACLNVVSSCRISQFDYNFEGSI